MEEWVAVAVRYEDESVGYYMTWGRIFDAVDQTELCQVVLSAARSSARPAPVAARLCFSIAEALRSDDAPYAAEALLWLAQTPIPYGSDYQQWREARAEAMRRGEEMYYCGAPSTASYPWVAASRKQATDG